MIGVTVVRTGPFFDGRDAHKLDVMCDEISRRVATIGASMIRSELASVLKVETPYYRLQNEARLDPPGWKISDGGVIYGPWLEGEGSRNFPVTRFKGYATYRRTFSKINDRAKVIAEYTAREYVAGM